MKTYFRLLSFARPFSGYVPQYIIFSLLSILFGLLQFTLLKPLFDVIFDKLSPEKMEKYREEPVFEGSIDYLGDFFNHHLYQIKQEYGDFYGLLLVCSVILGSVLLANLFKYLSLVTIAKIRMRMVRNLRVEAFDRVTRLHLGYFSNERKGHIMSRLTNDVQEVEVSIVNSLKALFVSPATIIIYLIVLFSYSVQLTVFSLVILPVGALIISSISKKLKKTGHIIQSVLGDIVSVYDETLSGMRLIKAFNARKYINKKLNEDAGKYADGYMSLVRTTELSSPISEFLGVFLVTGILLYGGSLILEGNGPGMLDASTFMTYIILFTQVLNPGKEISKTLSNLQRGLASGERIFELMDTKPQIADLPDAKDITTFNDSLSFKGVSFAYANDIEVLKNINLDIQKGRTLALVGASGGGKSTLADLIPRFYEPTQGEITIDGEPIRNHKIESLRGLMGIVTQESILFNDTVFNNIAFGMDHADKEEVIQAAKIANAHEFILSLEEGYDTYVGDRGTKLSGGQRQRLSIARAIMKNPPILILDEATSALDSESEKLVQEALFNLMKHRTSIVIAHRLSTIQHADEILVLQEGKIIERGTHERLLNLGGQYKKLTELQQAGMI